MRLEGIKVNDINLTDSGKREIKRQILAQRSNPNDKGNRIEQRLWQVASEAGAGVKLISGHSLTSFYGGHMCIVSLACQFLCRLGLFPLFHVVEPDQELSRVVDAEASPWQMETTRVAWG